MGEIAKKVHERRFKWYWHMMKGTLHGKEGDGNESTGEKE